MIFPNTDARYVRDIGTITETFSKKKRLFMIVNPFWRDLSSWGVNLLQPRAKGLAEANIFTVDNGKSKDGFVTTYSLVGGACLGALSGSSFIHVFHRPLLLTCHTTPRQHADAI